MTIPSQKYLRKISLVFRAQCCRKIKGSKVMRVRRQFEDIWHWFLECIPSWFPFVVFPTWWYKFCIVHYFCIYRKRYPDALCNLQILDDNGTSELSKILNLLQEVLSEKPESWKQPLASFLLSVSCVSVYPDECGKIPCTPSPSLMMLLEPGLWWARNEKGRPNWSILECTVHTQCHPQRILFA